MIVNTVRNTISNLSQTPIEENVTRTIEGTTTIAISLQLGNKTVPVSNGQISIKNINLCTNINSLQNFIEIYPDIQSFTTKPST